MHNLILQRENKEFAKCTAKLHPKNREITQKKKRNFYETLNWNSDKASRANRTWAEKRTEIPVRYQTADGHFSFKEDELTYMKRTEVLKKKPPEATYTASDSITELENL